MTEDTVIQVNDTVKDRSEGSRSPRMKAGFDMAADPNETLIFLPQIYISLGICGFICVFTLLVVIISGFYYTIGCFFWTILFATIVFVPDPMGHWIHWIIQCIMWMCFPLILLGTFMNIVTNESTAKGYLFKHYFDRKYSIADAAAAAESDITWIYVNTWVLMFPAIINAFLILRMTMFAVRNRGG